jgi:hypothetical protein
MCVFVHSRFVENPLIRSWETNPSFLRWFCHNQSAISHSPFEVFYGYKTRHFGIQGEDDCPVQHLDSWLQDRKRMTDVIRQHLQRAQI